MEMAEPRSNSSALHLPAPPLAELQQEVLPQVLLGFDGSELTQRDERAASPALPPSELKPSTPTEVKSDLAQERCVTSDRVDYLKCDGEDDDDDACKPKQVDVSKIPSSLVSFKEESNKVIDLSDAERNALEELKKMIRTDLLEAKIEATPQKREDSNPVVEEIPDQSSATKSSTQNEAEIGKEEVQEEVQKDESKESMLAQNNSQKDSSPYVSDVSLWGIPLLVDERSDVILLKYLRARDFSAKDAFVMLKNTIQWRKEFRIEDLISEELGDDLEKVVFMYGRDREGHPVCYNVYGEFQNKELYHETFADAEKRMTFLKWRIQFLEKSIRKLDFHPGAISTIFQVNDLKYSPGPGKRELRLATKQALHLLQDNYPEFVAKQVFINVPWWYLAFYTMVGPFMTQRTKRKFVFASPSRSVETLLKYISPEHLPIRYGGLGADLLDGSEFSATDPATSLSVKPASKQSVEIVVSEKCVVVWQLRVVAWEVIHGVEFVPDAEDAYTVIVQKPIKFLHTDAPVSSNSFKVPEVGKLLLTVDNPTAKKKELVYRFKIKPATD